MTRRCSLAEGRAWCAIVAWVLVVGSAASPAGAQPQPQPDTETRVRARALGEEGNALFDSGDYAAALDRYQRAAALVSVPTLGLKMARSLERLHRLVEASERYLAVTRTTLAPDALEVHREAVASAESERAALLPRIPNLVLQIGGKGAARVTLDGKELPAAVIGVKVPTDPGRHRVEARRGEAVDAREVTLAEGETLTVALDPKGGAAGPSAAVPEPSPEPAAPSWFSTRHVLGLGLVGLGVGGLAVGAGFGAAAASKKSELEPICGTELECPPPAHADADDYNRTRMISGVGFIAGGALAALGVVLVVIPSSKGGASATAVRISPGGAVVSRRF